MNPEQELLEAAMQKFYEALSAMFVGNIEPMKTIWSHANDVTYLSPTGSIRIGWQEVLADWEAQAKQKLGGKIQPSNFHYILGPKISIVVNREIGENIGPDGPPLRVSLRATHIFRKEKGEWKMIADHVDPLPFLKGKNL